MRIMTFALVGVLLFLVAMVVLQIFLSRRENKWRDEYCQSSRLVIRLL